MTDAPESPESSRGEAGKAAGAFRTIREVSDEIGVPAHVLRFWETRFPQLKPLQRGGNRRYYRPADVALAAALHELLHRRGMTVKGVQILIAEHGVGKLPELARAGGLPPEPASAPAARPRAAADAPVAPAALPAEALQRMRDRLASALAA